MTESEDAGERPVRVVLCGPRGTGKHTLLRHLAACTNQSTQPRRELRFAGYHPLQRNLGAEEPLMCRNFTTGDLDVICVPQRSHRWSCLLAALSGADVALVLVDADTPGPLPRDIRETAFAAVHLGVPHLLFAVKLDDASAAAEPGFARLQELLTDYGQRLGTTPTVLPLPIDGSSVEATSRALLTRLRGFERLARPLFRATVQQARETDTGALLQSVGPVPPGGASVRLLPSGTVARARFEPEGNLTRAEFSSPVECAEGDVVTLAEEPVEVSDQFEAELFWIDSAPGIAGRSYEFRLGSGTATATITDIKGRFSMGSLEQISARSLADGAVGRVTLSLDRPMPFEPYARCHALGGFALVDPYRSRVVGAGVIRFALRRARNVHRQALAVGKVARARMNGHAPKVLWLTGLSGSGKSTIADALEQSLHAQGVRTYILDGDNVRHGLNKDLGFTDEDRVENIRRIAEVAKLMADAGLVVITAFISPFRAERDMARSLFDSGDFVEVFVDVSLEVAEARDPKGLYRQARAGELPNFTGIDSPYEPPDAPEISLNTARYDVDECVTRILSVLDLSLSPPST